ncbi:MAG: hypothetical protein P8N92_08725 [Burkholderiales bacterium]|nr:hypothetical protein [Burkholderiales bacterium]
MRVGFIPDSFSYLGLGHPANCLTVVQNFLLSDNVKPRFLIKDPAGITRVVELGMKTVAGFSGVVIGQLRVEDDGNASGEEYIKVPIRCRTHEFSRDALTLASRELQTTEVRKLFACLKVDNTSAVGMFLNAGFKFVKSVDCKSSFFTK